MPSVARCCPNCKKFAQIEIERCGPLACPECSIPWGEMSSIENIFESCPLCQCRQFYVQKDFNQALGCLILLVGIILVPFTYGLSLPVFAMADWALHKRVSNMVVCYRCAAEFRGFTNPEKLKPFLHHIGRKYDKYR